MTKRPKRELCRHTSDNSERADVRVGSPLALGTHDNDTTAGWYRKLPRAQREALQKQLGASNREVVWAIICEALASQADTTIVPAQDLLGLGSKARMNFPGIAKGSWQWRL